MVGLQKVPNFMIWYNKNKESPIAFVEGFTTGFKYFPFNKIALVFMPTPFIFQN